LRRRTSAVDHPTEVSGSGLRAWELENVAFPVRVVGGGALEIVVSRSGFWVSSWGRHVRRVSGWCYSSAGFRSQILLIFFPSALGRVFWICSYF
jgi:hypothetical protein